MSTPATVDTVAQSLGEYLQGIPSAQVQLTAASIMSNLTALRAYVNNNLATGYQTETAPAYTTAALLAVHNIPPYDPPPVPAPPMEVEIVIPDGSAFPTLEAGTIAVCGAVTAVVAPIQPAGILIGNAISFDNNGKATWYDAVQTDRLNTGTQVWLASASQVLQKWCDAAGSGWWQVVNVPQSAQMSVAALYVSPTGGV